MPPNKLSGPATSQQIDQEYGPILRKMLSDPQFAYFQAYTNPGTAGGSGFYGKLGPLKVFMLLTNLLTNTINPTGTSYNITLPTGFFLATPFVSLTVDAVVARADSWVSGAGFSAATLAYYTWAGSAGASHKTQCIAIGLT